MKIVINRDYGGFGLSQAAVQRYAELQGLNILVKVDEKFGLHHYYVDSIDEANYWSDRDLERNDAALVQVVEELGKLANDRYASLGVVEIPDDVNWYIEEYDGCEHVAECHRTWR